MSNVVKGEFTTKPKLNTKPEATEKKKYNNGDPRPITVYPEYEEFIKHKEAAKLMSQIHYYYTPGKDKEKSKLGVKKGSRWYIAKSTRELAGECSLTNQQVDRALNLLRRLGLIDWENHFFNGKKVRHLYYLLVKGRGPITQVPDLSPLHQGDEIDFIKVTKSISSPGLNRSNHHDENITDNTPEDYIENNTEYFWSPEATEIPIHTDKILSEIEEELGEGIEEGLKEEVDKEGLKEEIQEETEGVSVGVGTISGNEEVCPQFDKQENIEYNTIQEEEEIMPKVDSAKEILKLVTEKKKPVATNVSLNAKTFYQLWTKFVTQYYPEVGCHAPFTLKESASAKRILEQVWKSDREKEILEFVIKDWLGYTMYLESKKIAFKTSPMLPQLYYLAKFSAEAKNYWHLQTKVLKPCKPVVTQVESKVLEIIEPKEEEASEEDILAWGKKLGLK